MALIPCFIRRANRGDNMSPLLVMFVAAIDLGIPQRRMMITIVWLGLKMGHRVRIGPIAATYWMSPLIRSPLLLVFLVV